MTLCILSRERRVSETIIDFMRNCMIVQRRCSMVTWVLRGPFWSYRVHGTISRRLDPGAFHRSIAKRSIGDKGSSVCYWSRCLVQVFECAVFPQNVPHVENLNSNQSLVARLLQISSVSQNSANHWCRRNQVASCESRCVLGLQTKFFFSASVSMQLQNGSTVKVK